MSEAGARSSSDNDDVPVFGTVAGARSEVIQRPAASSLRGDGHQGPAASGKGGVAAAARRREGNGTGGVVGGHHSSALGGDGKESEPPLSLWTRYLEANKKRPLLTKMITTGVLSAVGNVGGQLIVMGKGKQKRIDFKKLIAFILFGSFLSGPLGHMWLKFLNGRKTGLKGQQLVLYKISMDRLLYGPCFNAVQMAFVYKVSGQKWAQVVKSMQATFLKAQIMNFKMWPFAQYVNFNFIPPELQLLYMNCVALVWTITLTSMMN